MKKVVSVSEMREIEAQADAAGLTYEVMMANAGQSVAQAVQEAYGDVEGARIVILAGSGNNGGDGLVAGRHFLEQGAQVGVYLVAEREQDDPLLAPFQEQGSLVATAQQDQRYRVLTNLLQGAEVVVDAIFGTGIRLPVEGVPEEVLDRANAVLDQREDRPLVVAVDCPSGLDCDSGEVDDSTLPADLTVTLAAAKRGLFRFPGADYAGEVEIGDIGLDKQKTKLEDVDLDLATAESIGEWLPDRPRNSHKGTFGRVLIVAGSINLPGAALLAGRGAYRVGAGLVTLAVPSAIHAALVGRLPEATWILLPHEIGQISKDAVEVLLDELGEDDVILIGPGLGRDDAPGEFLRRLMGIEPSGQKGRLGFLPGDGGKVGRAGAFVPVVIDADALTLLSAIEGWQDRLPKPSVLTPHPGEMSKLTGVSVDDIQADRVASARKWAAEWGHVVVLKGAFTVVAAPDGRSTIIPFATSALASAGTGDVLAGAIAGLRAQGLESYQAAVAGGFIHGLAGEIAASYLGSEAAVVAGDVADAIADALAEIELAE